MNIMKPKADPTDTYASPEAIPRTPEELLASMTGMFLPPSSIGEINGLKILCLQRENAALKAEVERLRAGLQSCYLATKYDNVAKIASEALKTQDN